MNREWGEAAATATGLFAVAVAALLAAWGLGFGLPFLFRPDEDVMVGRAVRMAAEGTLDPLFQNYPPLVFDLLALAEKAAALAGLGTLVDPRRGDPSHAYLVGRTLSAAAGALTVGLVFQLGRRAYGLAPAAAAALILAVAPLAVRMDHFATTDAIQVAFMTAAMAAAAAATGRRGFAAAGAFCGLAAASKYTGGAALVFVLALAWDSPARRSAIAAALGGAAAAFALPSLVMLLHPSEYAHGLGYLGTRGFQQQFPTAIGLIYHPTVSLPFGLGPGAFALSLLGIGVAAWRRTRVDRALLLFTGAYFAVLAPGHEVFFRYVLPLLPALALLAGRTLAEVPRPALGPALIGCGLLLLPSLGASVTSDTLLSRTDTRVLAARWILAHTSGGSIALDYYEGPWYDDGEVAEQARYTGGDLLAAAFLQGRYTSAFDINGGSPQYRVIAVGPSALVAPASPHGVEATFRGAGDGGVYDPLDAFFLPIWGFSDSARPGPTLVITKGP